MKKKEIIYLLLAVVILIVAGYIAYTQFAPKKTAATNSNVQVEVVGPIPAQLSTEGISRIGDITKVVDYSSPVDLSALNNPAPFGP